MKDERSTLPLKLIKAYRKTASNLKEPIMALRDVYPDEVEEIRKQYKWRKV